MKLKHWILILLAQFSGLNAQRKYEKQVRDLGIESLIRFKSFLSLANDAAKGNEIEENIIWVDKELKKQGFEIKLLETSSLPLMIANLRIREKLPTIAIYMHIDGQAVDPSKWNQEDPYKAVIKRKTSDGFEILSWDYLKINEIDDLRIFARSSSDDKGPFAMLLTALDYLNLANKKPSFNIKLILDFEEEQSSPGLPETVKTNRNELLADLLLIFDGPMHTSGKPTLYPLYL